MANEFSRHIIPDLVAAADLSAKQYRICTIDSNGKAAICGATGVALGVLQNKPIAGDSAAVCWLGGSPVVLGGTVASGARVTSDANGAAIAATNGDSVLGVLKVGGVAGDVGEVIIGASGVAGYAAIS